MAIAHQPATAPAPGPARQVPARRPHSPDRAELPPAVRTISKLAGLVALTALGLALALAVVLGTVLFALFSLGG